MRKLAENNKSIGLFLKQSYCMTLEYLEFSALVKCTPFMLLFFPFLELNTLDCQHDLSLHGKSYIMLEQQQWDSTKNKPNIDLKCINISHVSIQQMHQNTLECILNLFWGHNPPVKTAWYKYCTLTHRNTHTQLHYGNYFGFDIFLNIYTEVLQCISLRASWKATCSLYNPISSSV